jgi:alginate O-acetyltransferase complex protein AlgI
MAFTSWTYLYFFVIVFVCYWLLRSKNLQNIFLLGASYFFYGYIHPFFCILILFSTIVDYCCGNLIQNKSFKPKLILTISLLSNLGMLAYFKYFNFFIENISFLLEKHGFSANEYSLKVILPAGISFYTFQSLSYTIDVYKGKMQARSNFIDFALFVSFFPQLIAGPIERAVRFLPQIEKHRSFDLNLFLSAWPLLIQGYLKKKMIADNLSLYVDKIYMLESPSILVFSVGTLAFAVQIFTDFSAYTDIARGTARLLGFELIQNFKAPYIAFSPSDFWKRWHISFSTWIRDYVYIPLGGSKSTSILSNTKTLFIAMGLSGLWHGAAWNYVIWGFYHAFILTLYRIFGFGNRWAPKNIYSKLLACTIMFLLTLLGWSIFRTSDMTWLINLVNNPLGLSGDDLYVSICIFIYILAYSSPMIFFYILKHHLQNNHLIRGSIYGLLIFTIFMFSRENSQDFIYFQF